MQQPAIFILKFSELYKKAVTKYLASKFELFEDHPAPSVNRLYALPSNSFLVITPYSPTLVHTNKTDFN